MVLSQKYQGQLEAYNRVYQPAIQSISEMDTLRFAEINPIDPQLLLDDADFMAVIYRQYLHIVHRWHRTYAPDLLFFGDVFNKEDWTEEMMRIAGEYVDAVALQPSKEIVFDREHVEKVYRLAGKPIVISDHKVSYVEAGYDYIQGREVATQQQAGQAYREYLFACFDSPYVIGFNRCMFKSKFRPGGVLKQGLLNVAGEPYDTILSYVKEANQQILQRSHQ
ncbi:MAG: hypothetical protein AAF399_13800 [Bacteroidota bacterium]